MPERTCDVTPCGRPFAARGYCDSHYREWRRSGVAGKPGRTHVATCSFQDCGRQRRSNGLCAAHYLQQFQGRQLAPVRPRIDTAARDDQGRKLCQLCREWLPTSQFYGNAQTKDSLATRCTRCHKGRALEATYGITLGEFEALHAAQDGVCAICGGVNQDGRQLFVDHDHETGAVRGLLCNLCNRGIGDFRDNTAFLQAAVGYLEAHEAQRE